MFKKSSKQKLLSMWNLWALSAMAAANVTSDVKGVESRDNNNRSNNRAMAISEQSDSEEQMIDTVSKKPVNIGNEGFSNVLEEEMIDTVSKKPANIGNEGFSNVLEEEMIDTVSKKPANIGNENVLLSSSDSGGGFQKSSFFPNREADDLENHDCDQFGLSLNKGTLLEILQSQQRLSPSSRKNEGGFFSAEDSNHFIDNDQSDQTLILFIAQQQFIQQEIDQQHEQQQFIEQEIDQQEIDQQEIDQQQFIQQQILIEEEIEARLIRKEIAEIEARIREKEIEEIKNLQLETFKKEASNLSEIETNLYCKKIEKLLDKEFPDNKKNVKEPNNLDRRESRELHHLLRNAKEQILEWIVEAKGREFGHLHSSYLKTTVNNIVNNNFRHVALLMMTNNLLDFESLYMASITIGKGDNIEEKRGFERWLRETFSSPDNILGKAIDGNDLKEILVKYIKKNQLDAARRLVSSPMSHKMQEFSSTNSIMSCMAYHFAILIYNSLIRTSECSTL